MQFILFFSLAVFLLLFLYLLLERIALRRGDDRLADRRLAALRRRRD